MNTPSGPLASASVVPSQSKVTRQHPMVRGAVWLVVPLPGFSPFDSEGKPKHIPAGTLSEFVANLGDKYGLEIVLSPDQEFLDGEARFALKDVLDNVTKQRVELGANARNDGLVIHNFTPEALVRNTRPASSLGLGVPARLGVRRHIFTKLLVRSPNAARLSAEEIAKELTRVREHLQQVRIRGRELIVRRIDEIEAAHRELAEDGAPGAEIRNRPDYLELADLRRQQLRLAQSAATANEPDPTPRVGAAVE